MDKHSLRRTSPKGPGQAFIGTCTKCGTQNLTLDDMANQPCSNPANLTQDEALMVAIRSKSDD